ncbi:hypothetical protein SDC9_164815 [bioreactor metagenome]|uniref:Uncharacterized protein n=1 Tax=bioreactor metagenome TaxID=1076179 RepID=A0A645FUY3_9ZZZZ
MAITVSHAACGSGAENRESSVDAGTLAGQRTFAPAATLIFARRSEKKSVRA